MQPGLSDEFSGEGPTDAISVIVVVIVLVLLILFG